MDMEHYDAVMAAVDRALERGDFETALAQLNALVRDLSLPEDAHFVGQFVGNDY